MSQPAISNIYRPRQPLASPLYQVIERFLPRFEQCYGDRYAARYGPWRPVIGDAARAFLRCGDLHFGFARVRRPDCRHELFVAFSCRTRCLCPSCHQKRTLLAAETIAHTICQSVPHRQLVFTIPKRLRLYFRYDRGLLGPKIGKWGQLQEWADDWDHPENTHRHLSHMIAVYPGRQITALSTPEFAEAARVSLNARGEDGDGGTGWSLAWKMPLWARLGDGDRAYSCLKKKMDLADGRDGSYPNLFNAVWGYFQIEGNVGYAAGFCEMLLQSHDGTIHLLPALPEAWPNGKVTGLVVRGNYKVDMEWKNGELTSATIRSRTGKEPKVRISDGVVIEDFSKECRIKLEN